MKKFILCSSVFLMLVLAGKGFADEHFPFLGLVKRGPVNVRAGANTNFEAIDKLKQGDEVVVLEKSYEWYKIQTPGSAFVYIRADYIKEHEGNMGEVIGSKVNIRCKPDSISSPVGQLKKGDYVKFTAKANGWYKLDPPAQSYAWVHADFVQFKSPQVNPVLKQLLTASDIPKPKPPEPIVKILKVQGKLQESTGSDFHYEIDVDGKPAYYLKDAFGLDRFTHGIVAVQGIEDAQTKSMQHPVIHIQKISLIL